MRREHKQAARRARGARWASGVYLFNLPVSDSALLLCPSLNSNRLCLYEMNRKPQPPVARGVRGGRRERADERLLSAGHGNGNGNGRQECILYGLRGAQGAPRMGGV